MVSGGAACDASADVDICYYDQRPAFPGTRVRHATLPDLGFLISSVEMTVISTRRGRWRTGPRQAAVCPAEGPHALRAGAVTLAGAGGVTTYTTCFGRAGTEPPALGICRRRLYLRFTTVTSISVKGASLTTHGTEVGFPGGCGK